MSLITQFFFADRYIYLIYPFVTRYQVIRQVLFTYLGIYLKNVPELRYT